VINSGVSQIDDEATARPGLAATGLFVDGPQWIDFGGGSLVFSSFDQNATNGKLVRIQPDGGARIEIRDTSGGGGVGIGNSLKGGNIATAISKQNEIWLSQPDGGDAGVIGTGATASDVNDLIVSAAGNYYFTDPQYQSNGATRGIYQIIGGTQTAIKTDAQARYNGVALSPDGAKLYVSVTDVGNGTSSVLSYTVPGTGTVAGASEATFLANAKLKNAPDGLAVDIGGNVWVAEADIANAISGFVEVFSAAGAKLGEIPFPNTRPTNVTFGGGNGTAVFITTEGGGTKAGVYKYQSRCAGLKQ
jgi:gluconolactonase